MTTLDALDEARAAMLDDADIPLAWTRRTLDEYAEQRALLDRRISVARAATATLAAVDPQIAQLESQLADLSAIRAELCDDLLACPPRSRNRADMDRLQALKVSILSIDGRFDLANEAVPARLPLFEKLVARGYVAPARAPWNPFAALFGSMQTIDQRLAALRKQRDDAQATLDAALRDPIEMRL